MKTRHFLLATLLLSSTLTPTAALAQSADADKATARDLAIEGYKALQSKDYAAAVDRFTRADALYHAPTVILGLARAHVGLGKLVSAQELYSRIAHESLPPNASSAIKKAVLDAEKELAALTPRIPGVILDVKGTTSPTVTLDGTDVPAAALGVKRPVDPGEHVIRVRASGFSTRELKVIFTEGKTETVTIQLDPEAPPTLVTPPAAAIAPPVAVAPPAKAPAVIPAPAATPPLAASPPPEPAPPAPAPATSPPSRAPAYILFGLAGASAIVGAAFAGTGFSAKSAYDKTPTEDGADKIDRSALIADIGFGSAILLGTAGVVMLLRKEPISSTTTAGVFLSPRVGTTGAVMGAGIRF